MRRSNLAVLLLLPACGFNEQSSPPILTGEFTVAPRTVFAGESVTISSPDLEFLKGVAIVAASDTLDLVWLDATTAQVALPPKAGSVSLRLEARDHIPVTLPPVTVYGFAEYRTYDLYSTWGELAIYPRGIASVIAAGSRRDGQEGLAVLNLEQDVLRITPGLISANWLRSPGPTPDPDVYLLRAPGSDLLKSYRVTGTPQFVDSFPGVLSDRQIMRMSSSQWFRSSHHTYSVGGRTVTAEETEGVYLSPRGDRATIRVDGIRSGLEVFDAQTGAVAYPLPLQQSDGVWFSDDGALLAVVGKTINSQEESRVLLVNAGTGAILQDTTLDGHAFAVTIDPDRGYVLVGELEPNNRPTLLVLRQSDFHVVARLTTPADGPACNDGCYKAIIGLGGSGAFLTYAWNTPVAAWHFTLPPP